ncbi:unnamed protein product [Didymodactylos carnosus]|uniref:Uncharacterized protein n=1 Tax=Didymodactylos carnosus TaxID=1234261 RepID=A0A815QPH0_9BILA|nr:unnamed protein product [Didymodactylos carnosus]CAF4335272.1 unnamed protein product [Didymodactylos carnosus]
MTTIFLILTTCFTIYGITFVVIGAWIQNKYQPNQLLQDGRVISGWFASFIITVTGFNQNGLAPWSDSLARFAEDVSFPTVQTRIYLLITSLLYITGVSISLILDLNNNNFAQYSGDKQFLIFLFHTGMTRFAGFTTIDISSLAAGTLIVYLLLMAVKPQMLCSMDETPFELEWVALKTQEEVNKKIKPLRHVDQEEEIHVERDRRSSLDLAFPIRQMNRFLRRQSLQVKLMAKDHYSTEAKNRSNTRENDKISMTKKHDVRREPPVDIAWIRLRLFFVFFSRKIITYTFDFLIGTRTWLFLFIFLICCFESYHMSPVDENITVFKIIFEIISAFGTCGLTLGYPNVSSSFVSILTTPSKIILIITMLMGQHRGLLDSMKDQEKIDCTAAKLLDIWKQAVLEEINDAGEPNLEVVTPQNHRF